MSDSVRLQRRLFHWKKESVVTIRRGIVHAGLGKISFGDAKLLDNVKAFRKNYSVETLFK